MDEKRDIGEFLNSIAKAETVEAVQHLLTNELRNFIPAEQICFGYGEGRRARLFAVSNVGDIKKNTSFELWIKRFLSGIRRIGLTGAVTANQVPNLVPMWSRHSPPHALVLKDHASKDEVFLICFSHGPLPSSSSDLCRIVFFLSAHRMLELRKKISFFRKHNRFRKALPFIFVLFVFLIPISTRVSMHAEVVSAKPLVVTAPINGVIKQVFVYPGQTITQGMLLATMDEREILAEIALREKELAASRAELDRLTRQSFADNSGTDRLEVSRAAIETSRANLEVSRQKLSRSRILAEGSGLAALSNPSQLQGAPVVAGQQILQIADPSRVEVNFMLPLTDTYLFVDKKMTSLSFFSDDRFWQEIKLNLRYCEYDPSRDSLGAVGHQCRATFDQDGGAGLGNEGTVVAYGPRVLLIQALIRKPLLYLRTHLGF